VFTEKGKEMLERPAIRPWERFGTILDNGRYDRPATVVMAVQDHLGAAT
jgi:hypothetical protein